ncbi:hypothetical protein BDA99DRAFT_544658 [Phascolomyces articulosus]|uniref:Uncharacterized protein n=1 Tax=Phascolomyces articulosus TaxID=60185 RepID=A0AAD5JWE3_9FUNG|nr:hypothetical protein BDA99DRAFT_544658 [Phascolomyces articulosus]
MSCLIRIVHGKLLVLELRKNMETLSIFLLKDMNCLLLVLRKVYPVLACVYGIEWPTEVIEVAQLVIITIGEQIDNKQDICCVREKSINKKNKRRQDKSTRPLIIH